jgi:hypothetical protein
VADVILDHATVGQHEALALVRDDAERFDERARQVRVERAGVDPRLDSLDGAALQIADLDRHPEDTHGDAPTAIGS